MDSDELTGDEFRPVGPSLAELAHELVLVYDLLNVTLEIVLDELAEKHREIDLVDQACFWKQFRKLDLFLNPDEEFLHVWIWEFKNTPRLDVPTTARRAEVESFRRTHGGHDGNPD